MKGLLPILFFSLAFVKTFSQNADSIKVFPTQSNLLFQSTLQQPRSFPVNTNFIFTSYYDSIKHTPLKYNWMLKPKLPFVTFTQNCNANYDIYNPWGAADPAQFIINVGTYYLFQSLDKKIHKKGK